MVVTALPSLPWVYLRALLGQLRPRWATVSEEERPSARLENVVLGDADLAAYQDLTAVGGANRSTALAPPAYCQMRTNGLQGTVMLRGTRNKRSRGLVHSRNRIEVLGTLTLAAPLSIECNLAGERPVKRGVERALTTQLHQGGAVVWRCEATLLLPHGRGAKRSGPKSRANTGPNAGPNEDLDLTGLGEQVGEHRWHLSAKLGRHYARISGDYNPIHLSRLSARPFGFQRAIAHGLWLAEHGFSAFNECTPTLRPPYRYSVDFLRPVFLPSTPLVRVYSGGFLLWDPERKRPLVHGVVHPLDEQDR